MGIEDTHPKGPGVGEPTAMGRQRPCWPPGASGLGFLVSAALLVVPMVAAPLFLPGHGRTVAADDSQTAEALPAGEEGGLAA